MSGTENTPARSRSSAKRLSTALAELASPNSPMKSPGWALLRLVDGLQDRGDLVARVDPLAADVELDERRAPVLRDLAGIGRRRAASGRPGRPRSSRHARRRPRPRPSKAGVARLRERLWIRTLSPAGCLNPASRIRSMRPDSPGPDVVGSMFFVADHASDAEGDDHERQPAEGCGLPVGGAPATHAGRDVGVVPRYGSSRSSFVDDSTLRPGRPRVVGTRSDSRSYQPTIPTPTLVGGGERTPAVRSRREPDRAPGT